jgi:predicted HTH domain antitoxin
MQAFSVPLFQAGSLSVGSAARIAGLPLPRFLEILASLRRAAGWGKTPDRI